MQKIYSLVTLAFLLAGGRLYAQPGVPATYIGDYSKMSSGSGMDQEMRNGNWAYRLENLKNARHFFTVTLKDNSMKEVKSKIYVDSERKMSYLLSGDQKIYCDETKSISRKKDDTNITGIATDSCWLFKVVEGKINAYSFLAETGGLNSFYLCALQIDGGAVRKFDPEWLRNILSNNSNALKLFSKKDYLKAIEKFNTDQN